MSGEKRSYIIFRDDWFVVRTKPITEEEAKWLLEEAYYWYVDRKLKARLLGQWGAVIDLAPWPLPPNVLKQFVGVYANPNDLIAAVGAAVFDPERAPLERKFLGGLMDKLNELARAPVEPSPLEGSLKPAARYVKLNRRHVAWDVGKGKEYTVPPADWYAYEFGPGLELSLYGISAFGRRHFWLWRQTSSTEVVILRRRAPADELAAALARDPKAAEFLWRHASVFARLIDEHEDELKETGYEDVPEVARTALRLASNAARRGEEEGAPA